MTSNNSNAPQFKSFVSEAELEERKRRRQEEWEKVRRPDQPLECPEEEYDPKSLYERLQEQKDKRQAEYEEAHRLKNLIKGLDDDEIAFLELVDKTKIEMESKRLKEDLEEIQQYRKAVATLSEEAENAKLKEFKKSVTNQNNSSLLKKQSNLVKAVKRKSTDAVSLSKKAKMEDSGSENMPLEQATTSTVMESNSSSEEPAVNVEKDESTDGAVRSELDNGYNTETDEQYIIPSSLQCMGVLPGMGIYADSSDSDNSSNSDIDQDNICYDLVGRRVIQATRTHHSS